MSAVPAFHTRAAEELEARTESAKGQRDRANSFLSQLDEVLEEINEAVSDITV